MINKNKSKNHINIREFLVFMAKKNPIQVFKKYGIGIQTQEEIKILVLSSVSKKYNTNG